MTAKSKAGTGRGAGCRGATDGAGVGGDVPSCCGSCRRWSGFRAASGSWWGDRLQSTALDLLERLIEATYTRARQRHLAAANLGIEKLRVLCRLVKDLRHLDPRRYAHAAGAFDEAGRLVGGWRKAHDAAQP